MANTILTPEVLSLLERSTSTSDSVTLPPGRLDPKLYAAVNKALEAAGGKWSKKHQHHAFITDPREALGLALETGKVIDHAHNKKKAHQAFYTPPELAGRVVEMAGVSGRTVLEPSAGEGSLALACRRASAASVWCIDNDYHSTEKLANIGFGVSFADFLDMSPGPTGYERIVMNPPFTRDQDVKHVAHALKFLAPGGRLVAIMADAKTRPSFRALISGLDHEIEPVPAGAFRSSGTNIATIILTVNLK